MKLITQQTIDELSRQAAQSVRRRMNLNLHDDYDDPCQRLFNALEPDSYVRPHRHIDPPKPECFVPVRGRMALLVFDDHGRIEEVVHFGVNSEIVAIELPPGLWHMLVALEPGSIFFEAKPGPYRPVKDKDFAPWSPEEGSVAAPGYLADIMTKVAKECP